MIETVPEKTIVIFVTLLISYLQLTANFGVLGPALGGWTFFTFKVLAPMNLFLISIYVNYYLACTTDPGSIPEDWVPPEFIMVTDPPLLSEQGMVDVRFCNKCDSYKPPRSHHCKQCKRCVLKMDHHCPWINNCVGYNNYSYFIRFIYSVIGCCTYGSYLLLWRLQRIIDEKNSVWYTTSNHKSATTEIILIGIDVVLASIIVLFVGILSIYHTYCLFRGNTTIEGGEIRKTKRLIKRKKIDKVEFPFRLSVYNNICSVFGNNPILWVLPLPPPGDGIKFEVKEGTNPLVPYCWPPCDLNKPLYLDDENGDQIINEQENGSELVRRDSEGYLVKPISMQDRMRMLYEDNDADNDSGYGFEEDQDHNYEPNLLNACVYPDTGGERDDECI
ncbi:zf-DHHC-domain-containing protein [Backusella circina FSU 941]|nr:zf-DHHC-domain-containing protein [Backusella circina FSU 941]